MFSWVVDKVKATASLAVRHKKKVALAVVVGGGYYVYRRVKPIIDEVRESIRMMESAMQQQDDTAVVVQRRQQELEARFARCLRVADTALLEFVAHNLRPILVATFDVQAIRARMQKGRHDVVLWDELKVEGFARTVCTVYTVVLLEALVRIQLSVLSRYDLMGQTSSGQVSVNFMTFSRYLQSNGLRLLMRRVKEAAVECAAQWKPTDNCTFEDVELLLAKMRAHIERGVGGGGGGDGGGGDDDDDGLGQYCPYVDPERQASMWWTNMMFPPTMDIPRTVTAALAPSHPTAAIAAAAAVTGPGVVQLSPDAADDEFMRQLFHFTPPLPPQQQPGQGHGHGHDHGPPQLSALAEAAQAKQMEVTQLAEMLEEIKHVTNTTTFSTQLTSLLDVAFDVLRQEMKGAFTSSSTSGSSGEAAEVSPSVVFAKVIIRATKVFEVLVPERLVAKEASPLLHRVTTHKDIDDFCRVIFFPLVDEATSTPDTSGGGGGGGGSLDVLMRQISMLEASPGDGGGGRGIGMV